MIPTWDIMLSSPTATRSLMPQLTTTTCKDEEQQSRLERAQCWQKTLAASSAVSGSAGRASKAAFRLNTTQAG